MKSWRVSEKDSGLKLVSFLQEQFEGRYSSRKLKHSIENNLCKVNAVVERFASRRLKSGDRVQFDESSIVEVPAQVFEVDKSRILYEDESLLFYDKPAGLSSDESGIALLFNTYFLVHRLDRGTTGVLVLAKSAGVKEVLIELFREFAVKKVYLALVDGVLEKKRGSIENYLGNVSTDKNQARWDKVPKSKGKFAKTSWELVQQGPNAALVKCRPETGRTHQIRVHMKILGHPILGDYTYAKKYRCSYHAKRCMLHALTLSFPHPVTGKQIEVEAPLPEDFKLTMKKVLD
jgi:RluA family pseudouridine synthase